MKPKQRKLNFKEYFYVFLNSRNKFEKADNTYFILEQYQKGFVQEIKIEHYNIWRRYELNQYKDQLPVKDLEIYERGTFEDYMGNWVKVNDFVRGYNKDYEYKFEYYKGE